MLVKTEHASIPVFICVFLSIVIPVHAQQLDDQKHTYDYAALYKLEFAKDSNNRADKTTDYWCLFMDDSSSFFTSVKFLRMDEIKREERLKGNPFGPSMDWYMANGTKNILVVHKNKFGSEIICHDKVGPEVTEHYVYYDEDLIDWTLLEDTLSIGGAVCHKAVADFGGRQWHAWYNPELPLSDGPYKFRGLPGLIYHISDTTGTWQYSLVSLKQEEMAFLFNCSDRRHFYVSKDDFYKNKRQYYDNRITIMKSRGHVFWDERKAKANFDKDNNWIERYP